MGLLVFSGGDPLPAIPGHRCPFPPPPGEEELVSALSDHSQAGKCAGLGVQPPAPHTALGSPPS